MHMAWMTDQMILLFTELGQKQIERLVRVSEEFHFHLELEVCVEGEVQQEPGVSYKIKWKICHGNIYLVVINSDNHSKWRSLSDTGDIKWERKAGKWQNFRRHPYLRTWQGKRQLWNRMKCTEALYFAPTRHCFLERMNIVSYTEFPWKDVHLFQWCCHCSKHFIRFSFILPLD